MISKSPNCFRGNLKKRPKTGKEKRGSCSSLLTWPYANRQKNKETNTYQLAVGIIWCLEPWCIVNVINMRLCLSLPCHLGLLFYQMFHRNARAIQNTRNIVWNE